MPNESQERIRRRSSVWREQVLTRITHLTALAEWIKRQDSQGPPDGDSGPTARANAYLASVGMTVRRVLTDNGNCYRSRTFADALGPQKRPSRLAPFTTSRRQEGDASQAQCASRGISCIR